MRGGRGRSGVIFCVPTGCIVILRNQVEIFVPLAHIRSIGSKLTINTAGHLCRVGDGRQKDLADQRRLCLRADQRIETGDQAIKIIDHLAPLIGHDDGADIRVAPFG